MFPTPRQRWDGPTIKTGLRRLQIASNLSVGDRSEARLEALLQPCGQCLANVEWMGWHEGHSSIPPLQVPTRPWSKQEYWAKGIQVIALFDASGISKLYLTHVEKVISQAWGSATPRETATGKGSGRGLWRWSRFDISCWIHWEGSLKRTKGWSVRNRNHQDLVNDLLLKSQIPRGRAPHPWPPLSFSWPPMAALPSKPQ